MRFANIWTVITLAALWAGGLNAQTPGAHLGDLTWPEAAVRLAEAPLVIIPMGAGAKEHGPQLPLRTDQLMLEHLMGVAVDSLPVIVTPPVLHGWFAAFEEWPGTNIGDPDVFRRYMEEIARSLVRHGARRIVFLNTGVRNATGPAHFRRCPGDPNGARRAHAGGVVGRPRDTGGRGVLGAAGRRAR